jgi:CubicO group peptidase (beta-lactamase class C family)
MTSQLMTNLLRGLVALTAVAFLSVPSLLAQQTASAKIDAYIKTEMRRQKIPGISLAVIRKGKIELLKSYGLSNVEHQVPVKPETVFQSGSIGKQFTASAVMLLVEEGKAVAQRQDRQVSNRAARKLERHHSEALVNPYVGHG